VRQVPHFEAAGHRRGDPEPAAVPHDQGAGGAADAGGRAAPADQV